MANMHRETLKLEAETKVALCRCGQSQNLPYCDGAHRTYQHPEGILIEPIIVTTQSECL